jgi:hypothetical protein
MLTVIKIASEYAFQKAKFMGCVWKCLGSVSSLVRSIYTVVRDTTGLVREIEREGHERLCTATCEP